GHPWATISTGCGYAVPAGLRGARGNQDSSALKPSPVEIRHRVVDRVEWIGAGVQADLALGGEGHELLEVRVGADQVADERDLARDHVDRRNVDVLAVADHVVEA